MPCYMTGSYEGDLKLQKDELAEQATNVTQLLCTLCEEIELYNNGLPKEFTCFRQFRFPSNVNQWWKKHKEIDRKRKLEEELEKTIENKKKKAISKLTPEEKYLLGIK